MTKIRNLVLGAFAVALSFGMVGTASAVPLYDGSGLTDFSSSRSAENAPLARFRFTQDVEITSISSLVDPNGSGNVKFVIFDSGSLVFSSALSFSDTGGFQTLTSAPLTFNAVANTDYLIGSILDVAALYSFSIGDDTQGVATNISANGNITGFVNPTVSGGGGAVIAVSLDGGVSAVPLPAVAPMLLAALAALGFVSTRRSTASA